METNDSKNAEAAQPSPAEQLDAVNCPVIGTFARFFYDRLTEAERLPLLELLPVLANCRTDSADVLRARGFFFLDRAVRGVLPILMAQIGSTALVEKLNLLAEITDELTARGAAAVGRQCAVEIFEYERKTPVTFPEGRTLDTTRALDLGSARDLVSQLDRCKALDLAIVLAVKAEDRAALVSLALSSLQQAIAIK